MQDNFLPENDPRDDDSSKYILPKNKIPGKLDVSTDTFTDAQFGIV